MIWANKSVRYGITVLHCYYQLMCHSCQYHVSLQYIEIAVPEFRIIDRGRKRVQLLSCRGRDARRAGGCASPRRAPRLPPRVGQRG